MHFFFCIFCWFPALQAIIEVIIVVFGVHANEFSKFRALFYCVIWIHTGFAGSNLVGVWYRLIGLFNNSKSNHQTTYVWNRLRWTQSRCQFQSTLQNPYSVFNQISFIADVISVQLQNLFRELNSEHTQKKSKTHSTYEMYVKRREYMRLAKVYAMWSIVGLLQSFFGFNQIMYYSTKHVGFSPYFHRELIQINRNKWQDSEVSVRNFLKFVIFLR